MATISSLSLIHNSMYLSVVYLSREEQACVSYISQSIYISTCDNTINIIFRLATVQYLSNTPSQDASPQWRWRPEWMPRNRTHLNKMMLVHIKVVNTTHFHDNALLTTYWSHLQAHVTCKSNGPTPMMMHDVPAIYTCIYMYMDVETETAQVRKVVLGLDVVDKSGILSSWWIHMPWSRGKDVSLEEPLVLNWIVSEFHVVCNGHDGRLDWRGRPIRMHALEQIRQAALMRSCHWGTGNYVECGFCVGVAFDGNVPCCKNINFGA